MPQFAIKANDITHMRIYTPFKLLANIVRKKTFFIIYQPTEAEKRGINRATKG